jgi:hypothetical protein
MLSVGYHRDAVLSKELKEFLFTDKPVTHD